MAANLRDPGPFPSGDPKRFQDSSNYVVDIAWECFSSAAGTHLATDLTCKGFLLSSMISIDFLQHSTDFYLVGSVGVLNPGTLSEPNRTNSGSQYNPLSQGQRKAFLCHQSIILLQISDTL